MKILIPTIGLDNRGGTRIYLELANHFVQRGHQVTILVPRGSNITTFSIDPRVVCKPIGFSIHQIEDVSSIVRLAMLFPLLHPCDVVLANYYLTSYPIAFSGLFHRSRISVNLIQHYEPLAFGEAERTFPRLKKWIAETSYRFPMHQVAVANWIATRVTRLSKQPVRVIYPNINLTVFKPSPVKSERDWNAVLAFPGKDIWKGWHDFTRAFSNLHAAMPGVNVRASSPGPFPLPQGPYTAFHPKSDAELVDLYRTSAVYVHASWWEGCPLAPLEAMACATPVVAAASEGIMEYAVDGENCLLVPPQSPDALAEALKSILKDKALHRKLVEGGLETVKRFGWPRMADEMESFILEKTMADKSLR